MTDDDRREDLRRLYAIAVEEYRFQVQTNTQRFQWNVAIDVAVLTIATGLLRVTGPGAGRPLTGLLFGVGAVLALTTGLTVARQVDYQHRAREQATKIAAELGLSEYAVQSTPGWTTQHRKPWPPKVRTVNYLLLGFLGLVNLVGIAYVIGTA